MNVMTEVIQLNLVMKIKSISNPLVQIMNAMESKSSMEAVVEYYLYYKNSIAPKSVVNEYVDYLMHKII